MELFNEGDLVVVNDLPDACVYTIHKVDQFSVEISSGSRNNSQVMDISLLKHPTNEQISNMDK